MQPLLFSLLLLSSFSLFLFLLFFPIVSVILELIGPKKNVLNNELLKVDVWLRCNKLSVNIKKTYVTFSPSQRKLNHSFSLSFGGQPLIQSKVTKFLGVYLDEHLTWKYHINFVCKQIAKSMGILSRTRFYLSCKTKLIDITQEQPVIIECIPVVRTSTNSQFFTKDLESGNCPPSLSSFSIFKNKVLEFLLK